MQRKGGVRAKTEYLNKTVANVAFEVDGYILTQCIRKGGKEICRPNGKFYKFPAYTKGEKQKSPEEISREDSVEE